VSERDGYAAGTPCWVDVSTSDLEMSKRFYAELFGWSPFTIPDPQAGGYTLFRLRDRDVAALMQAQEGTGPPAWSTYIASDDADATAAVIQEAGGTVVLEPMDVMDAGRMLFAQDPTGAYFGVWQSGQHKGSALANEPGAFTWNELVTRDVDTASEFYAQVFGWEAEGMGGDGDGSAAYQVQNLGGGPIGGIRASDSAPGDVAPHWEVYFAVGDADATVARAEELGGRVRLGPIDTPFGPMAQLVDPVGASFAIIALAEPGP
jgi:predicted enzyme related to lactoylglutathione lyase